MCTAVKYKYNLAIYTYKKRLLSFTPCIYALRLIIASYSKSRGLLLTSPFKEFGEPHCAKCTLNCTTSYGPTGLHTVKKHSTNSWRISLDTHTELQTTSLHY